MKSQLQTGNAQSGERATWQLIIIFMYSLEQPPTSTRPPTRDALILLLKPLVLRKSEHAAGNRSELLR